METSYISSPLFVHSMHLNILCFIIIIIVKVTSQSSHLPWEPIKVNPWEKHYLLQPILRLYILQLIVFFLIYSHPLQMTFISQVPFQLYALEHFQTELHAIGVFIKLYKCVAWSRSNLLFNFNTPSQFITPLEKIRVLGVPLGTSSFISSLIKNVLLKDVHHVDLLPKIGDVQMAFGILTHCFMQWPLYLLQYTLPSSTFIKSLTF